jgi:polysaccharide biosynthesis/export protein
MIRRTPIWMVILLAGLVTAARAQDAAPNAAAGESKTTTVSAADNSNYVIGPQDVLEIDVWKELELTRTVPVRPDGKISMPLLNDVQAAGLTPDQLASQITASLRKFVTNPQVTVIVSQINSQRVYIMGEVIRAGAYPLMPGMTVLEALSSAGGFTPFAKRSKIYVMREENGKQQKLPFDYKAAVSGKGQNQSMMQVEAGDTIVVP